MSTCRHAHFFHHVALLGTAVGPAHVALACPEDQPDDPWYIASDEPADLKTLDEYRLRFDIEESFLDEKSGEYQIQTSELATPEALERLILILAIATLHFTSVWSKCRPYEDTPLGGYPLGPGRCRYMQIGWRWRRQQYQRGWQAFVPFWLDPTPDSAPAIASRRAAISAKRKSGSRLQG